MTSGYKFQNEKLHSQSFCTRSCRMESFEPPKIVFLHNTYNRRKNVNSLSYVLSSGNVAFYWCGVSLKNQSIHVNLNYHLPAKRPKSPPLPSPPWQRQTRKSSKQPQCFHPNFLCSNIIPSLAPQPNLHFLKGQLFWQNHGSGSSVWPTFYIKNRKEKNTKRC